MPNLETHKIHASWALVMKLLLSSLKLFKKKNCIVLWSWLCRLTFDVLEIHFIAPTETLYLSCIRVLQLPQFLNLALLRDFFLMVLKLVTRKMLINAMVHRAESHFTELYAHHLYRELTHVLFIWSTLMFESSWASSSPLMAMWLRKSWLFLFFMESRMEIVFLAQHKTFNLDTKGNQNVYWKDLSPRGNCKAVCKYVVIKYVIMNRGKFVSAKSGLQNDWFDVRMLQVKL